MHTCILHFAHYSSTWIWVCGGLCGNYFPLFRLSMHAKRQFIIIIIIVIIIMRLFFRIVFSRLFPLFSHFPGKGGLIEACRLA